MKTIYHQHKQSDNQSLLNGSTKELAEYSSYGCVCCDTYNLSALIMHEIDDITKAIYIAKVKHYYDYDTTQFMKCYLMIKYIKMNEIKWNIINNNKIYLLINLLYVLSLYETIWVIISILLLFIITKYLLHHWCILFDYYHKQNINYKSVFMCFYYNKIYNKNFTLNTDTKDINLEVIGSEGCCIEIEFGAIDIDNDGRVGYIETYDVTMELCTVIQKQIAIVIRFIHVLRFDCIYLKHLHFHFQANRQN